MLTRYILILTVIGLSLALVSSAQEQGTASPVANNSEQQTHFYEFKEKILAVPGYEVDKDAPGRVVKVPAKLTLVRARDNKVVGHVNVDNETEKAIHNATGGQNIFALKDANGNVDPESIALAKKLNGTDVSNQQSGDGKKADESANGGMSVPLIVGLVIIVSIGLIIGLIYLYRSYRH